MALDEANHRLFVGCRLPSRLVVLNTDSGDVVAKIDISGDCDDVFYDSKRHRYMRSAAPERSTLSSRLIQTPIEPQPRSIQQMALAPGFSCRNATPYS